MILFQKPQLRVYVFDFSQLGSFFKELVLRKNVIALVILLVGLHLRFLYVFGEIQGLLSFGGLQGRLGLLWFWKGLDFLVDDPDGVRVVLHLLRLLSLLLPVLSEIGSESSEIIVLIFEVALFEHQLPLLPQLGLKLGLLGGKRMGRERVDEVALKGLAFVEGVTLGLHL